MLINNNSPLLGHQATTASTSYRCLQSSNQVHPSRAMHHGPSSSLPPPIVSSIRTTLSHMTAYVARASLQDSSHVRFLFSLLHASFPDPSKHTTASQSLRRLSCAESPQDPLSSFYRVSPRSKHREDPVLNDFRRSPPCNVRAKRRFNSHLPTGHTPL